MKLAMMFAAVLAASGTAGAQQTAVERVVTISPDTQWTLLRSAPGGRAFIDRRSIRREGDTLRYTGRIVMDRADQYGVVELLHVGEISCSRNDYRIVAFDMFGGAGEHLGSHRDAPGQPATAISPESNNADLHAEFCG